MPNKNKPNAFMVYAQTIKPRLLREGHTIKSTADLVAIAGPYWKELDEDEKEVYKEMAKNQKQAWSNNNQGKERPGRRDNTGELISERVDMVQVTKQRRMKERLETARMWPPAREVIYEKFYFIAFSVMCDLRNEKIPDHLKIIPCEVSVVEYCIDSGIDRVMHKFINPGKIPLGHRYNATAKSESTHKIPVEGMGGEEDSYSGIYTDICSFIMRGKKMVPPLFCKASETVAVEGALRWLAHNAGADMVFRKVCELEGLLLDLDSHLEGHRPNMNASEVVATKLLSSSVYDYERNTRCKYHEDLDVKFCSLGMVKKWSYLISDYLCSKAGVTLTVNHLPCVDTDADTGSSTPVDTKFQFQQQSSAVMSRPQQQQQQLNYRETGASNSMRPDIERESSTQQQQPRTIGRGRAFAAINQPRRPGEASKEQQPRTYDNNTGIARGAGRGSRLKSQLVASQQSFPTAPVSVGRGTLGMEDAMSNMIISQDGSVKPRQPAAAANSNYKFAMSMAAPPASLAPQPPNNWRS